MPEDWRPPLDSADNPLKLIEFAYIVGLFNYTTRLADGFSLSTDHPTIAIKIARDAHRNLGMLDSDLPTETHRDDEPRGEVVSLGWFLKVRAAGAPNDSPYNFGYRSEMATLLSAHPRIGPVFWALFSEIMFNPGALTPAEREMVAAVAAAAQDCHY